MRVIYVALGLVFAVFTAQAEKLTLSSEGIASNALFPVLYSCDGQNSSPPMSWVNVPKNTRSFSVIVEDVSSLKTNYLWVLFNIPSTVTNLDVDLPHLPPGATEGKNSLGKKMYNGPCPINSKVHTYKFTLFALSKTLDLPVYADATDVLDAMKGSIIEQSSIAVNYTRWRWPEQ